jgi:Fe-S-cluster containining protein
VIRDGKGFEQPCGALEDRSCAIYEARPSACRTFVCKLHEMHRVEGGPLEPKLAIIKRTRELLDARKHTDELEELLRHFDRILH